MRKIPIAFPYYTQDEAEMVSRCLKSGWVVQGPMVAEFERKTAAYENVRYGIAVTSCTTALHLLISALGICEGQDVLVPSFTFVATANAVEYTGATAVLIDVETETYCADVEKLQGFIEHNYRESRGKMFNTKNGNELSALIAVHLFGICANMPAINQLAQKYNIRVIEDAACALGASINGTHEGNFGNPSCLSFHARKSITTGEGGMILTDDDILADKLRRLRSHGATISEVARHNGSTGFLLPEYNELGFNYRMTDIQGAVGVSQVDKLDYIIQSRREQAARYDKIFAERFPFIRCPSVPNG